MRAALFVAFVVSTLAIAQALSIPAFSYQPAPSLGHGESSPPKPTSASDQRATARDQHPAATLAKYQQPQPSDDAGKPSVSSQEENDKSASDWWLVFWTGALFVATVGVVGVGAVQVYLFWSQLKLIRESLGDTKTAAEAAKQAAEAAGQQAKAAVMQANVMMAAERARLIQTVPLMGGFLPANIGLIRSDADLANFRPTIGLKVANIGGSAGILNEVRAEIRIGPAPESVKFAYSKPTSGEQVVRPDTQTDVTIPFPLDRAFTRDEWVKVRKGDLDVWFFGTLKYEDTFFILHEKGFAFHVLRGGSPETPWVPVVWGGKAFNYERQIEDNKSEK